MAMGIVSDHEFYLEKEKLNSPDVNESPTAQIIDVNKGRGNNPEVPNGLRNIIGETATENGRQEALALARNFGISDSSVSAYSRGATSTISYDDTPNSGVINGAKERISKKARGKLLLALNQITDEKIRDAKLRDISGVARDMSAIVKNMEDSNKGNNDQNKPSGPTFIFYSPQTRKEEVFDVVHAKE